MTSDTSPHSESQSSTGLGLDYSYLIGFSDDAHLLARRGVLLVAVGLVPLVDVEVAVHLVLRVGVLTVVLVIPRFLGDRRVKRTLTEQPIISSLLYYVQDEYI